MGNDDEKNLAKVTALTRTEPTADEEREDLALVEADAKATVATIAAIGEQVKAFAESPGVKILLEGMGQSLAKRWDYETAKLEKEHELRMQADRLAAETQRRRDIIGSILVGGGLLAAVSGAVALVVLVAKGIVTAAQAAIVAGVIASLATGLGFGRKMQQGKP